MLSLGISDSRAIYNQINPGHLGAVGDLAALLAGKTDIEAGDLGCRLVVHFPGR